jgi:cytochrome b subunit of formate dehydrogenase
MGGLDKMEKRVKREKWEYHIMDQWETKEDKGRKENQGAYIHS